MLSRWVFLLPRWAEMLMGEEPLRLWAGNSTRFRREEQDQFAPSCRSNRGGFGAQSSGRLRNARNCSGHKSRVKKGTNPFSPSQRDEHLFFSTRPPQTQCWRRWPSWLRFFSQDWQGGYHYCWKFLPVSPDWRGSGGLSEREIRPAE